ncbi:hypothetical protein BJY04DRAFT_231596 [Aspergillus karnatakaensis]|uniref:uncharacterized protein n=1 Tax=Aspergillus karnatakaensis TaxID=1810916 RepID=UPI003CCD8A97
MAPQTTAVTPPSSPVFSLHKRAANVTCGSDPRMPPGSWDSHLHVMDPVRYPPIPEIPYTPGVYTVWDNAIFESSIGCKHVLFVQTATHGNDMTLMLDSIRAYGTDRALGVGLFDPSTTTPDDIQRWDQLGVRGVRVNLVTYADQTPIDEFKAQIRDYVDLIQPVDWVLQLYVKMETIPALEDFLPTLGVRVVFDHYGDPIHPEPTSCPLNPYDIKGFNALVRLLQQGSTWVKISGAYRFSHLKGETWEDLDPVTLELLKQAPDRVVYGSDWPHTRFDGLDIKPWVTHLLDLTEGNKSVREKLFRDNARVLWGVEGSK